VTEDKDIENAVDWMMDQIVPILTEIGVTIDE
jgi:hypothetical protein